jgi:hypothetical protein
MRHTGALRKAGEIAGGAACGPILAFVCAPLGDKAVNRLLDPTNEAPPYFGAHYFHGAGLTIQGNPVVGGAEMTYAVVGGGMSAGKWLWNQVF